MLKLVVVVVVVSFAFYVTCCCRIDKAISVLHSVHTNTDNVVRNAHRVTEMENKCVRTKNGVFRKRQVELNSEYYMIYSSVLRLHSSMIENGKIGAEH